MTVAKQIQPLLFDSKAAALRWMKQNDRSGVPTERGRKWYIRFSHEGRPAAYVCPNKALLLPEG